MNITGTEHFQAEVSNVNSTPGTNATLEWRDGAIGKLTDQAVSVSSIIILFITMISLGCTMELSRIKEYILKPKAVLIALFSQYGIMPLTAFSLARIFRLSSIEAISVLICGCCPGGTLSNIFSLAVDGDMNLRFYYSSGTLMYYSFGKARKWFSNTSESIFTLIIYSFLTDVLGFIVMTTCSTTLALGMMPLLLYLYCKGLSLVNNVPYRKIILTLVSTLIPCSIGVFLNHRYPKYSKIITKTGLFIFLIAAIIIVILSVTLIGANLWTIFIPRLIVTTALMPAVGFTLGYALSSLCRLSKRCTRTVSMETGFQNIQLCSTILKVTFSQEEIGALYLFPIIFLAFQLTEALILVMIYRTYERVMNHKQNEPLSKKYTRWKRGLKTIKSIPVVKRPFTLEHRRVDSSAHDVVPTFNPTPRSI